MNQIIYAVGEIYEPAHAFFSTLEKAEAFISGLQANALAHHHELFGDDDNNINLDTWDIQAFTLDVE